jgi:hypothetical protein
MKAKIVLLMGMVAVLIFLPYGGAKADIVQIDTGEEYNGKVTDFGDSVRIELLYGTINMPKYRIVRIIQQKTVPEIYADKLADINPKDAEARFQLALWCKKEQWMNKSKEELEIVIILNPNHEGARRMLGYRKLDKEWVTEEEYMIAKGFVKHEGKWIPKELAVELAKLDQTKEIAKARSKELKEKKEMFEKSQKLAITSAFMAQQQTSYGRAQKKGGEFEFNYNFGDGSGFAVKASAYNDETRPRSNFYYSNPYYPLTICTPITP